MLNLIEASKQIEDFKKALERIETKIDYLQTCLTLYRNETAQLMKYKHDPASVIEDQDFYKTGTVL